MPKRIRQARLEKILRERKQKLLKGLHDELFEKLIEINRAKNLPIVMVEQNAYAALEISHRAYVLATGEVVMEGGSAELLEKDDIVESYLGTKADGD